jgi:hypothetical protein
MNANDIVILFIWEHLIALVVTAIVIFLKFRWKIPVVILRYTGDKRRPTMIVTKARNAGNGRLIVKGYKLPVRNFKSENYYPSAKGAHGALLVWEFKRGWLTPIIPKKVLMKLSEDDRVAIENALNFLQQKSMVKFEFNEELYAKLMVEAIDDVDAEFFLRQLERQGQQYTGGLRDFLMKHGGAIAIVIVSFVILTGYIIYLDKVPSLSGQCIEAGVSAAKSSWLSEAAKNFTSAGVPLG